MEYLIPVGVANYEQEIKRSRFVARIRHIDSVAMAKQWFVEIGKEFPDARHVCWAYIADAPGSSQQSMNDDGEPVGTAGKPILNVLQHSGAGEIAAVVVRYFGGIKLGAGGLVRAYSSSVAEVLKRTQLEAKIPLQHLKLVLPFAEEHTLRYLLERADGQVESVQYGERVSALCQLPIREVDIFLQQLPHSIRVASNEEDA